MGCCRSRQKVKPVAPLETVNVQPKTAPPTSTSSPPASTSSTQPGAAKPVDGVTMNVQAPVRNPSDNFEPQRNYSQEQVKAAQKIGAVARGSVTRTRATEEYHETARGSPASKGQDKETNPSDVGWRYAEMHATMPKVNDGLRYRIRDATAARVLKEVGSAETLSHRVGFGDAGNRALQKVSAGGMTLLSPGVRKQMNMAHLFLGEPSPSQPTSAQGFVAHRDDHYLIGKFDCVGVPVKADYGRDFSSLPSNVSTAGGAVASNDCDGATGFSGWFWILHAAAPNIGESAQADDFVEYSREESLSPKSTQADANPPARCCWKDQPPSNRPKRRLDEDLYIQHMARIWRNCLLAMRKVHCEDAVVFPFGMGAFLRHLGKNDERYTDPALMRQLRLNICNAVMGVISEVCCSKDGAGYPRRVHVCLVTTGAEAIENHNCFVEAAGAKLKTCPALASILCLRKNVDALQCSHELALSALKAGGNPLSVCLLNGANRKLCGNHWFQNGARFAIDENIHRRSASASRAALLLNFDTETRPRKPGQLQETVRFLGGSVISIAAIEQEDVKSMNSLATTELPEGKRDGAKGTAKAGFVGGDDKVKPARRGCCGCCRKKSQSAGTSTSKVKPAKVPPPKTEDQKTKS